MTFRPRAELSTHTVFNQVPELADRDLVADDVVLQEGLRRYAPAGALERAEAFGRVIGSAESAEAGRLANRFPPELRVFDRYGHRVDEATFHPSYHHLFSLGVEHGVHNAAWVDGPGRSHVLHAGLEYLFSQVEAGICCPLTMTYAAVPALRVEPAVGEAWVPRLLSSRYDPRSLPAPLKRGSTMGMAMTEKQGGSDVRSNTTRAVRDGEGWRLRGHKFFCSAPMCDGFLTLAYTEVGQTCFLVPRWLPDGTRNALHVQRLKDKLGNRSNASSEIEYHDTWAMQVGEEGRGVRTILEMVHHTRLDCTLAAAGLMRAALSLAHHHVRHRQAFGARLIDKPLMRNVMADLSLEWEAATALFLRVAAAFDAAEHDPAQAAFARIAVAVAKYWTNKRCPPMIAEAMECLGGAGYVEESDLPRLFRESPLNGIWEGSGNVICLDVLRAIGREPGSLAAFLAEVDQARGADARLDRAVDSLRRELADADHAEYRARRLVEQMAVVLAASLLVRHAPPAVADAWCATRLEGLGGIAYGTLPTGVDTTGILARVGA